MRLSPGRKNDGTPARSKVKCTGDTKDMTYVVTLPAEQFARLNFNLINRDILGQRSLPAADITVTLRGNTVTVRVRCTQADATRRQLNRLVSVSKDSIGLRLGLVNPKFIGSGF